MKSPPASEHSPHCGVRGAACSSSSSGSVDDSSWATELALASRRHTHWNRNNNSECWATSSSWSSSGIIIIIIDARIELTDWLNRFNCVKFSMQFQFRCQFKFSVFFINLQLLMPAGISFVWFHCHSHSAWRDDDKSIDRYDERVKLKLQKVFKWNPHMPHQTRGVVWLLLIVMGYVRQGQAWEFSRIQHSVLRSATGALTRRRWRQVKSA